MNLDFLNPILGDDLFAQFAEKVSGHAGLNLINLADGSYIPKGKLDDERSKVKTLTAQITELNGKLEAATQGGADADALNRKIKQLEDDLAERDQKMQSLGLNYRIKDSLRGLNARNVDVIMPLLKLDAITEKDGQLVGLSEQVEQLKKTDGYLFAGESNHRGGFGGSQDIGGAGSGASNADVNAAIRSMTGRA